MKRSTVITLLILAGFAALLTWQTLAAQAVECTACVRFNGAENCATASGQDEKEALTTVVSTACGTLAQGMDESIRCAGMPPLNPRCRTR